MIRSSLKSVIATWLTGLLSLLPLALTLALLAWLFNLLNRLVGPSTLIGQLFAALGQPFSSNSYLAYLLGSLVLLASLYPLGLAVQLGLLGASFRPGLALLAALLFLFFCGFNVLEATQPSLVSRIAPPSCRGAALGVYNTLQSLGFFAGGAVGGWLAKNVGVTGLFGACAGLMLVWLVVAWPMRAPRARQTAEEVLADEAQAT